MCPVVVNFSILRADLDKKTQNVMEQERRDLICLYFILESPEE
jgi:hypothetical protein